MMRGVRATSAALVLLVLAAACTGDDFPARDYSREDLPLIVLQPDDAPVGTTYVDGDSGYVTVETIAEDQQEVDALTEAGFVEGYLAIFFDPKLYERDDELNPEGSLALSYALRFGTPNQARAGLNVLEADIRSDSGDIEDRPTEGFGPDALALYGQFDIDEPPGFLYLWRVGNVLQILVAAGARDAIREEAARTLALKMVVYARNPSAQVQASTDPTTTPSST